MLEATKKQDVEIEIPYDVAQMRCSSMGFSDRQITTLKLVNKMKICRSRRVKSTLITMGFPRTGLAAGSLGYAPFAAESAVENLGAILKSAGFALSALGASAAISCFIAYSKKLNP